ncbi:bifunctional helix-turn-helix transcriptional regulator/GNAT family N-acetyltransferase [Candidimonas humi]|uniref:GNAT family N-acetyltransferase n=1 Tax=Candidimonas humi TaxID=683355 RepID=A0ABV8P495_9BURK|nr:helix-turn-helix domain-containing GNAT family N-acetyltransferase [Candidimonas humi]MBV6306095.1 bifunctional helix-turn-helix transcriptional regulator/GNAT family N-acetyltransferase [Candidimonas humi]
MGTHDEQLQQVRRFNRTVTRRVGALDHDYLGSGRPLAEARLLFEIGAQGATVRELRARFGLDSGYVSRLLHKLERQGLLATRPDPGDGRVRRVGLTPAGRKEWRRLDRRSKDQAAALLSTLGASQRTRLLAAMAEVERLLRAAAVTIEPADPAGREARACLQAYFDELSQRFEQSFDPARGPSADPESLVPPAGLFLVARLDGMPVACGAIKLMDAGFGEIKRMWVDPAARGLGIAQRLLEALEKHAVSAGLNVLRLDTNRNLTEARALYANNGFVEIAAYNDNPYAHHWFEKRGLRGNRAVRPTTRQRADR